MTRWQGYGPLEAMDSVPYVDDKTAEAVRGIEERLRSLHPTAGVLFISVSAVPVNGGSSTTFSVRLGLKKGLSQAAGEAIVQTALRDELALGFKVDVSVLIGVPGAANDPSHDGAHQAPT